MNIEFVFWGCIEGLGSSVRTSLTITPERWAMVYPRGSEGGDPTTACASILTYTIGSQPKMMRRNFFDIEI